MTNDIVEKGDVTIGNQNNGRKEKSIFNPGLTSVSFTSFCGNRGAAFLQLQLLFPAVPLAAEEDGPPLSSSKVVDRALRVRKQSPFGSWFLGPGQGCQCKRRPSLAIDPFLTLPSPSSLSFTSQKLALALCKRQDCPVMLSCMGLTSGHGRRIPSFAEHPA